MIPGFAIAPALRRPDPNFSKLALYLIGGQPDESTTFRDDSLNKQTLTPTGTTLKYAAGIQRFGRTSIQFGGSNEYLTTPASAVNSPGAGDFQVAVWFMPSTFAGDRALFDSRSSGSDGCAIYTSVTGNAKLCYANNSAVLGQSTTIMTSTSTWYHVRVARVSGTVYGFINEVLQFTVADSRTFGASLAVRLGATHAPASYFGGRLNELTYHVAHGSSSAGTTPTTEHADC